MGFVQVNEIQIFVAVRVCFVDVIVGWIGLKFVGKSVNVFAKHRINLSRFAPEINHVNAISKLI